MINVRISKAGFKEGRVVVKDVGFTLGSGELLLLVGSSGAGKTTLILAMTGVLNNLLNGFTEGYVNIYGVNPLTPEGFVEVPKIVGVVLQDPEKQLAMPTPYDEVLFTLENLGFTNTELLTLNVLDIFGLRHKAYEPVENLSGGEKKRLCIAASIAHKPKLIIFDEPTASLDPWGISEVVKYVKTLKDSGYSVIVIEHKARYFLPLSDRVIAMDSGKQVLYVDKPQADIQSLKTKLEALGVDSTEPQCSQRTTLTIASDVVLKARDIWFKYPTTRDYVLRNVNLTLRAGDVAAIVGRNGSGKTTLLKVLAGLYSLSRGYVEVCSIDLRRVKGRHKAGLVFYVPQEPDYVFTEGTVLKEIKSIGRGFEEVISEVSWVKELLNESPYRLSHGQRRWLAYTIAKLYSPKIVLLDEPSAGMDLILLRKFIKWVREVSLEGKVIVIATHDVRIVTELASRAFIMDEGTLKEVTADEAIAFLEEPVWRG